MSRTPNIGVVGVKYWAYMAEVMAGCLGGAVKGERPIIPINVFRDAWRFFGVVLGKETRDIIFDNNPPAQSNAYVIAWDVLNDCPSLRSDTLKGADGHFRRFAEFLESLEGQPTVPLGEGWGKQPAVPLSEEDQKTASDLRDFFAALVRKSDRDFDYGESRD